MLPLAARGQGTLARGDDEHWDPRFGQQGLNDVAFVTATDRDGFFVGGRFTVAGTTAVGRVARWGGATWENLGGGVSGDVIALAVDSTSGDLYAGGVFQAAGGAPASMVARWDGTAWHALGAGAAPSPSGLGYVSALAVDQATGELYAGGRFEMAGGITVNNVARWDGVGWHALGGGLLGNVNGLVITSSGELVAAGTILEAGGVPVHDVARWDGQTWAAVGDPGLRETWAVAEQPGGALLVGGAGADAPSPHVLAWGPVAGSWTPVLGGLDAGDGCQFTVTSIAASDDHLYVGSGRILCFPEGQPDYTNSLLERRGTEWTPLGSGIAGLAWSLALAGDDLYVGGEFASAGGRPSLYVAHWNETIILGQAGGPRDSGAPLRVSVSPNPMRGASALHVHLGRAARITVRCYSMLGQLVGESTPGVLPEGDHVLTIPVGRQPSGVYGIRVEAASEGARQFVTTLLVVE